MFGRGTDFICYDDQLIACGGVHVISTFVSEQRSEEVQLKGRTARQGNKGSFGFVLLDSELERYGISLTDIADLKAQGLYFKRIDEKRCQCFEERYAETKHVVADIVEQHIKSLQFVDCLLAGDTSAIREFLVEQNQAIVGSAKQQGAETAEVKYDRMVVLMDATGSMGALIDKAKNAVETMVQRIYAVVEDMAEEGCMHGMQLQFIAYRNWNSSLENLLQASSWACRAEELKLFMSTVKAKDGYSNEAVEVGLFAVNAEHDRLIALNPEDGIKRVILIGDMPPNTVAEVNLRREKHGEAFWAATRYNNAAIHFEPECVKLAGKGIVVDAFWVKEKVREAFARISQQ